jgi:hypothetical protein
MCPASIFTSDVSLHDGIVSRSNTHQRAKAGEAGRVPSGPAYLQRSTSLVDRIERRTSQEEFYGENSMVNNVV